MPGANSKRCPCCGQRSNLRKLECVMCGAWTRSSRAEMTRGYHPCRCGGVIRPVCLVDVAMTAGDPEESRAAYAEYAWKFDHEPCPILSARAQKAALTRKTRATFAAVRNPAEREGMPF